MRNGKHVVIRIAWLTYCSKQHEDDDPSTDTKTRSRTVDQFSRFAPFLPACLGHFGFVLFDSGTPDDLDLRPIVGLRRPDGFDFVQPITNEGLVRRLGETGVAPECDVVGRRAALHQICPPVDGEKLKIVW